MSKRHPLGKRSNIFYVRMHSDEMAHLKHIAARRSLSPCDYARARLLEEVIPALPPVLPPAHLAAIPKIRVLRQQTDELLHYCSARGPIDWSGQTDLGVHVYDQIVALQNNLAEVLKTLTPGNPAQGARLA